jgi:hypothetical protein
MTTFTSMDIMKRRVLGYKDTTGKGRNYHWENLSIGIGAAMVGVRRTNPADVTDARADGHRQLLWKRPTHPLWTVSPPYRKKEGPSSPFRWCQQRSLYVCLYVCDVHEGMGTKNI